MEFVEDFVEKYNNHNDKSWESSRSQKPCTYLKILVLFFFSCPFVHCFSCLSFSFHYIVHVSIFFPFSCFSIYFYFHLFCVFLCFILSFFHFLYVLLLLFRFLFDCLRCPFLFVQFSFSLNAPLTTTCASLPKYISPNSLHQIYKKDHFHFLLLRCFFDLIRQILSNFCRCKHLYLGSPKDVSSMVGAPWRRGVLATWSGRAGIGVGHLLRRNHDSTPQSGVEAPRLFKLFLWLLLVCVVCVVGAAGARSRRSPNAYFGWAMALFQGKQFHEQIARESKRNSEKGHTKRVNFFLSNLRAPTLSGSHVL